MLGIIPFETTTVTYADFSSIITAITSQVSVSTVVPVLASAAGIAIALVFMWWGIRKVTSVVMGAFRSGHIGL